MKIHNNKIYIDRRKELRRNSTQEEKILWNELRNSKLGQRIRRQHSIGGYILDFYCFKARLIIEIDGKSHELQREYDEERDNYFRQLDYQTLRIHNNEISKDLKGVINKIKQTLSLRLGEGALSLSKSG